jgi:hypothetical protein
VRLRAVLLLALTAAPLAAQRDKPRVEISVNPATALAEGPAISSENLLADARTREHLQNGFPARLHYRLELWKKGGVFDDLAGRTEWDVLVAYDPTAQRYNMIRRSSDDQVRENFGGFATITSADAQVSQAFRAALHPSRSGRFYYNLNVDVETLTLSDLDEVQQWLRGPTSPSKANPLTAIRSGIGTLLSRVLGGSATHYNAQSGVFAVP